MPNGIAALDQHVADSLAALAVEPLAVSKRIVDIGSGAGFPGLALAAVLPHAAVDLLEANERKAELIARLASTADIANARAVNVRAEDWARADGASAYDCATARALAAQSIVLEYAAPLLRLGGVVVSWKGSLDETEARDAAAAASMLGLEPRAVHQVMPFAGARGRYLHVYGKETDTPPRFPRRAGVARKRPLR